ncbi:MAG: glycoside hydrolase, family 38 [Cyanobacteria bacterium RYN_339]|nr:glycoside hydrolase, family 38 [Cyanobacteria bacterium RYN_339]
MPETTAPHRARPLHVVPHTHWDREWYRPFEAYRYRLVRTLDRVLASDLPYFLLDGQTAVIDDYLALRPQQEVLLRDRIREGRLGIGPWYVLVDEFLVSGEALVRNLLTGRAAMRKLGATDAVGYLPDMFGHVAQMPQILAGFGLDQAVVWRGVKPPAPRFAWRAPDGSGVTAAWLPAGYYQTMFMEDLPLAERQAQLEKYLAAFGAAPSAWLLAGADHMAPRADLAALVAEVQAGLPDVALEITSLRDALTGPAPTAAVAGELREPVGMAYILPGVLSARVPLKLANAACQTLLERYVEPLTALAGLGGPFLGHAWRTLMLNHPHDSICGCSIDQVHREMWPRFAAVDQIGQELIAEAVGAHDKPLAAPGVFAFNPTGWAADAWVELSVDWPLKEAPPEAVTLTGPGVLAVQALGQEDTEVFRAEIDFNPDWFPVRRFKLAARLALPALGGTQLQAVAGSPAMATGVRAGDDWVENEHLLLAIREAVDLKDKRTGRVFTDCHGFLDEGDAGDEYNFSPLAGDRPRHAVLKSSRLVESGPHAATLEATYELEIPVGLTSDRQARSEQEVLLTLISRFTLRAGAEAVEVETRFENLADDHRLRLCARWGSERPRIFAEGTFGVFERPAVPQPALPVPKGTEAVMPEFPTSGFTALVGEHSLAVAAPGLYEGAWLEHGALGLTLLRAVGWLSRDDLRTRGGGAGPRFPTPEAQDRGAHTYRYALIPGGAGWVQALRTAHQFLAPARAWLARGLQAPGIDPGDPRLVVSALKRAEDGHGTILRVYNASGDTVPARRLGEPLRMDETRLDDTSDAFRPYEVKTWRL